MGLQRQRTGTMPVTVQEESEGEHADAKESKPSNEVVTWTASMDKTEATPRDRGGAVGANQNAGAWAE